MQTSQLTQEEIDQLIVENKRLKEENGKLMESNDEYAQFILEGEKEMYGQTRSAFATLYETKNWKVVTQMSL